jgi:anaerobic magnesium-protoporphyrin IX monomethyl ester cyclase
MNDEVLLISLKTTTSSIVSHYPEFSEYLGLSYVSGALHNAGITTLIIDCDIHKFSTRDLFSLIHERKPLMIGISGTSQQTIEKSLRFVNLIRKTGFKNHITIGGHFATKAYEYILNNYLLDSVVLGEGEITAVDLFHALNQNKDITDLPGLAKRVDGKLSVIARPSIQELDLIPKPKRYNLQQIVNSDQKVPIVSSRGCNGGCSFCMLSHSSRKWRARTPRNVVDEIQELHETSGARRFRFVDENYFGHCKEGLERAEMIAEEIKKRKLDVQYKILSRVDDLDERVLKIMMESGLSNISVGVESYNQRQLDDYNKGITLKDIDRMTDMISRLGLRANFSFIMFDPLVTPKELKENVRFISHNRDFFEPRRLRSRLRFDYKTPITEKFAKSGLAVLKGDFEYETHFENERTARIWSSVQYFNKRFDFIQSEEHALRGAYLRRIADKKEEGSLETRDYIFENKINELRRQIMDGWVDILNYCIEDGITNKVVPSIEAGKRYDHRFSVIYESLEKLRYRL